jgi:pimeloyl-ACP methyl ester carboxylesterase
MQPHMTPVRAFTVARIIALALIALAAGGLVYLHGATERGSLSVPAGAHAGRLTMHPCTYDTESGGYRADCGTLVVRENRARRHTRLIALPVIRIRARSQHPGTPLFRLEGGPGLSNMSFAEASRYAGARDVVLVGYRGVDGSSVLRCPEVVSALAHSGDLLSDTAFRAKAAAFRHCATRLAHGGVDLAGYTPAERVDDFEAARVALGYRRIDLLSESAGTRTAMIYSWRHPGSIRRSVMIGANPPGHFLWNPQTTDAQLRSYAGVCAKDEVCGARTLDLAVSMRRTVRHMPDHWLFLPIKPGNVRLASFFGLMDSTEDAAPLSAPATIDAWFSAANGDASGLWFMSLLAGVAFPDAEIWGDVAAASRTDHAAAQRYFSSRAHDGSILGDPGTEFLWAGGRLLDAWPSNASDDQYSRVRDSNVETLVISGSLDLATPSADATRELMPHLPNGHQFVIRDLGHTTDFWSYDRRASSRLITTFLSSGAIDGSLYARHRIDFRPLVTDTRLAKGIAGTMVGLAAFAVLSLLWLWRRAHTRSGFGRVSSAVLRTLHPAVLGLGGWSAGALTAMLLWPAAPLDGEALAVLAAAAPVGLGIYWAWIRRDWTAATRAAGFAAAVGGSLAGGWCGYRSVTGMLSLPAAVAGAAIGANLMLIALDIARDAAVERRRTTAVPAAAPAIG